MTDDELFSAVSNALNLPLNRVTLDLTMEKTDAWDSLKHMDLIVAIEALCQIELTFEEIVMMKNVADIKRVLAARGIEVQR